MKNQKKSNEKSNVETNYVYKNEKSSVDIANFLLKRFNVVETSHLKSFFNIVDNGKNLRDTMRKITTFQKYKLANNVKSIRYRFDTSTITTDKIFNIKTLSEFIDRFIETKRYNIVDVKKSFIDRTKK